MDVVPVVASADEGRDDDWTIEADSRGKNIARKRGEYEGWGWKKMIEDFFGGRVCKGKSFLLYWNNILMCLSVGKLIPLRVLRRQWLKLNSCAPKLKP